MDVFHGFKNQDSILTVLTCVNCNQGKRCLPRSAVIPLVGAKSLLVRHHAFPLVRQTTQLIKKKLYFHYGD